MHDILSDLWRLLGHTSDTHIATTLSNWNGMIFSIPGSTFKNQWKYKVPLVARNTGPIPPIEIWTRSTLARINYGGFSTQPKWHLNCSKNQLGPPHLGFKKGHYNFWFQLHRNAKQVTRNGAEDSATESVAGGLVKLGLNKRRGAMHPETSAHVREGESTMFQFAHEPVPVQLCSKNTYKELKTYKCADNALWIAVQGHNPIHAWLACVQNPSQDRSPTASKLPLDLSVSRLLPCTCCQHFTFIHVQN